MAQYNLPATATLEPLAVSRRKPRRRRCLTGRGRTRMQAWRPQTAPLGRAAAGRGWSGVCCGTRGGGSRAEGAAVCGPRCCWMPAHRAWSLQRHRASGHRREQRRKSKAEGACVEKNRRCHPRRKSRALGRQG